MKWLKRILLGLVIIALIVAVFGYFFLQKQRPNYDENITIEGLTGRVDIHYDDFGIPHIYGATTDDTYRGLGYAHAKDRLWQMELLRRIAPGRLSEILGPNTIDTDKFFRAVDIATNSKDAVRRFQAEGAPEIQSLVNAYLEGVNHYIANGQKPIEYTILGIERSPYTLEDIYNVFGYMAFSFAMAHKTEPVTTQILKNHGQAYLNDLNMHVDTTTVTIDSDVNGDLGKLSMHVNDLLEGLPVAQFIGSNSWVISPSKTTTGGAIFANDPHIGFAQPSVWYEAHLEAPNFSLYGNFIGGSPIALIGNTRHHAIGVTMFENDDMDLYQEEIDDSDTQYSFKGEMRPLVKRTEMIPVKGGEDVAIEIKKTHHGSIISHVTKGMEEMKDISMFWVYQKFPNRTMEAAYQIMNATSVDGVKGGAAMLTSPGLNIMYGDVDGNIAYWAAAKLLKRPEGAHAKLIMDGSSGEYDIIEYYDFEDNPQAVNPEWGYVYSANNQSVSTTGIAHEGYYLPEDRARRIKHLLDNKSDWNTEDVKGMITDVTSMNTPEITASLIGYLENTLGDRSETQSQALSILSSWDGRHSMEDIAPTIYYKWLYLTMAKAMKDEVGEGFEEFLNTFLMKRSLQPLIANNQSIWWDDVATDKKETSSELINESFGEAIQSLEKQLGADISKWKWERVHTIEHAHALGANETLRPYFNVGPYHLTGSREVINNLAFALSGDGMYEALSGPSCRRVINMNALDDDNWSILPTGQSGNRWSPHYKDQAEMFNRGEFRRQLMNKEDILKVSAHHSILKPTE
ncbi:MAG: penicillin amidase [Saprospiraceae bacterium]|jgi:penicillin amidase